VVEKSRREEKSRSQIKREFLALRELGRELAGLSRGQLRSLPLSEETHAAVLATEGLTRSALQRQQRYLASLLAQEDVSAIRAALAGVRQPHAAEVARLHEAERWRARLLSGDERQLAAFVERYPECDRERLELLVRDSRREHALDRPPRSSRLLFRYLMQLSERAG
jgi:ribosome-associated protein